MKSSGAANPSSNVPDPPPPDGRDEALRVARTLSSRSPEERSLWFQACGDPLKESGARTVGGDDESRTWMILLSALFHPGHRAPAEGGPFLVPLLDRLMDEGRTREEAYDLLRPFLTVETVLDGWSNWTEVGSTEEIYVRLKVLSGVDVLPDGLIPFLQFYVQSSNPFLYQEAAITAGTHLDEHEGLCTMYTSYAQEYDVPPGGPIVLDGSRNRRRMLLMLVAARAKDPEGFPDGPPIPVPFDRPGSPEGSYHDVFPEVSTRPQDVSILLRSFTLLCTPGETHGDVQDLLDVLIRYPVDEMEYTRHRELVKNWCRLLSSMSHDRSDRENQNTEQGDLAEEAGRRVGLWASFQERVRTQLRSASTFAERLADLFLWDELAKAPARLSDRDRSLLIREEMIDDEGQVRGDRKYNLLRVLTWCFRRENMDSEGLPEAWRALPAGDEYEREHPYRCGLEQLKTEVQGRPGSLLDETVHRQRNLIKQMLEPFEERSSWRSRDVTERALRAFMLMDATEYTLLEDPEVNELTANTGNRHIALEDRPHADGGLRSGTLHVLLTLLNWEGDVRYGSFPDARFLHRIEEPRVLLTLLPSRTPSSIGAGLADAIEHKIRMLLKTDPDFDVYRFLIYTTVRNPDDSFYDALLQLTRQRSYNRERCEVPVTAWLEQIRAEVARGDGNSGAAGAEGKDVPGRASGERPVSCRSFHDQHGGIRTALEQLLSTDNDLPDQIDAFTDLLGDPFTGVPEQTRTLLSLVGALHGRTERLLRSGTPIWREGDLNGLEQALEEPVAHLHALQERLHGNLLEQPERMDDRIAEGRSALRTLSDELLPHLPYVEQVLVERVINRLDRKLGEWGDMLEQVDRILHGYGEESTAADLVNPLFELLSSDAPADARPVLMRQGWEALRSPFGSASNTLEKRGDSLEKADHRGVEQDAWANHLDLLDAGCVRFRGLTTDAPQRETMLDLLRESWEQLLRQAMERGEESRVERLLNTDEYEPFHGHPASADVLDEVEGWWFDRYAVKRGSWTAARRGGADRRGPQSLISTFVGFITHFTPLWIALMLGAFFMLDFGNAWTAMARSGDLVGVIGTVFIGLTATYLYLLIDLRAKSRPASGESAMRFWVRRNARLFVFLEICLVYTFALVSVFWYLLSGTEEVVTGPNAFQHVMVWTGFTLFSGVVFGLIAQDTS